MNRKMYGLAILTVVAVLAWGCAKPTDATKPKSQANATTATDSHDGHDHAAVTVYCGKCGQVKGSDVCCAEGAEKCECGMTKGSPLCCVKLEADAVGKDLCGKCGHVHEANHHCDSDCESCECGLHKDSPLCCKLKKS